MVKSLKQARYQNDCAASPAAWFNMTYVYFIIVKCLNKYEDYYISICHWAMVPTSGEKEK